MTDIFRDRKLIHVKLDKDTHAVLRSELFKAGLTMQEILSEFCHQYINKAPYAVKLIEHYVVRKNRYQLQALEQKVRSINPAAREYGMTAADKETLYDMLDETSPLGQSRKAEDEENEDI